jgi:hypothetical protein
MIKRLLYLVVLIADLALILMGAIDWKIGLGLFGGFILIYMLIKRLLF